MRLDYRYVRLFVYDSRRGTYGLTSPGAEDAITGTLTERGGMLQYRSEGSDRITGTIHEVHRLNLRKLDAHFDGFTRRLVVTETGERVNVYEWARTKSKKKPQSSAHRPSNLRRVK